MMKLENKVLACVDQSKYADYVTDYAAWAARRIQAPLELLHIFDRHPEVSSSRDRSGAIGIDAQEELLTKLATEDEERTKVARDEARMFMNRLRERALAAGVESVDVRLRQGHLDETLVAQEKSVRLLVLGRRGETAELTQRDIGRNVERVIRSLQKPILTVIEHYEEPKRVMIAFDGSPATRRGVDLIAASSLFSGLEIHLLMASKEGKDSSKQFDWARGVLANAGIKPVSSLMPGDAETIIAREVKDRSIDILVMGAYSHSPFKTLFFGSTTADLLRATRIPTLIVR